MRKPVITLLTDFGIRDHYVAAMKGVILTINPRCSLIDITHQVNPHHIEEAAFILAHASSFFPRGTIHLCVVDPGVGGPRRPILMVTSNYFFVGPDNGLFTYITRKEKVRKCVVLTNQKYFLKHISTTFHGRDLFAPVAAHLSLGAKPEIFGYETSSWEELRFPEPKGRKRELLGEIIYIDAFGNLITNIDKQSLLHFTKNHLFSVGVDKKEISGLKKGYWEGRNGELMALFGSSGFLEVSVREGNAQKSLKAKKGDRIEVLLKD
jgi:S-adenosyl-L-methionine hydrolase (adenosine-forming)